MKNKKTGEISADRPKAKAAISAGGGNSRFKVRIRDTVSHREMVRVLPFPPFNGLYLFIPWLKDDRAIDNVKWSQASGVFDAVMLQHIPDQCPDSISTCVLKSDDCPGGLTILLPYIPRDGMWLPIPWRDGQFFQVQGVFYDEKESRFDLFIEYTEPIRAEPPVRMSLHEYLDNIFTDRCNGIDNYACAVETLGKILGDNPILEEEVRLINQLSKTLKRLCDLRDEANTEFENHMNAEQPGVGVSPAA